MTPDGWRWESLDGIARGGLFTDGDWVESKDQDPNGHVRLTQLADVGVGEFRHRSDRWMREDQATRLNCSYLRPGDVLIARMPDPIGRACLVPDGLGHAVTAVDVAILRVARPEIDARYVMWATNSPAVHQSIAAMQSGTTRKRISRKNLATIRIPIPSLAEQRRIVAILEEHLSDLDAARRSLQRARSRIPELAESIIDWEVGSESASAAKLSDLVSMPLSNGRSVRDREDGFPVLRLTAMKAGTVDLSERKSGDWTAHQAASFLVRRGDFMIARGNGSLGLVGRGALVDVEPDEVAFPDTMIRARPAPELIEGRWLSRIWNSRRVRDQIERVARTSAGIYKVNQAQLNEVLVPLLPIDLQRLSVKRLGAIDDDARRCDEGVGNTLARAEALRRAVLAAAFSGRLTGQGSDTDVLEEQAEQETA